MKKKDINTVILVLTSIIILCPLYIGLVLNAHELSTATMALGFGLAFLIFGALPHTIGLIISLQQGKTEASVIILIFTCFWLYLGLSLFTVQVPIIHKILLYIELPMFLMIFVIQYYYRKVKELQLILVALGATILFLWFTKVFPELKPGTIYIVGALGIASFATWIKQLIRHQV